MVLVPVQHYGPGPGATLQHTLWTAEKGDNVFRGRDHETVLRCKAPHLRHPHAPMPVRRQQGRQCCPEPPPYAQYARTQRRRRPPALYRLCQADELQRYRLRHAWEEAGGWEGEGEGNG